ncbi:MAG: glutaredoxin family protein [Acidobacteriota bacterium]|nr:glutaredoxin family protein [Acidobacteriota bacterium]
MNLFRNASAGGPPALRLLSRPGCHLCDEMHAVVSPLVASLGGTLETVDVDSDPALRARWGNEIPVLLDAEGRVLAKVRDSAAQIARRLGTGEHGAELRPLDLRKEPHHLRNGERR